MGNMRPASYSLVLFLVILLLARGSVQALHATDHLRIEIQAGALALRGAAGMDLSIFA